MPAISCLGVFGRRPPERVERFVIAGSRNLHTWRPEQVQHKLRLLDHLVGAGEQKSGGTSEPSRAVLQ